MLTLVTTEVEEREVGKVSATELVRPLDEKYQKIEGNFVSGWITGHGSLSIDKKVSYSGDFLKGKPHGSGTATYTMVPLGLDDDR